MPDLTDARLATIELRLHTGGFCLRQDGLDLIAEVRRLRGLLDNCVAELCATEERLYQTPPAGIANPNPLIKWKDSWSSLTANDSDSQIVGTPPLEASTQSTPSTLSFREAVRRVLRAADQPLHSTDIWLAVQQMGITSNAKNPVGNVDLTCHGLKGVTKVGSRTWQWTGEQEGETR